MSANEVEVEEGGDKKSHASRMGSFDDNASNVFSDKISNVDLSIFRRPQYTGPTPELMRMLRENIETFTTDQLLNGIKQLETDKSHYIMENAIFEKFLSMNDPPLLNGMQVFIDQSMRIYLMQLTSNLEKAVDKNSTCTELTGKVTTSTHRINLNLRTDLVLREVEELQTNLDKFLKRSHSRKCMLKAELEEIAIRAGETAEASQAFEQMVVVEGMDPITQKIAAEKFIKYMNDWIKSAQFTVDKMRLRCGTVQSKVVKLSNLVVQKRELGENIHEVDFEKITIENERVIKKIEIKNSHLIELKKMTGNANLVLTNYKNFLQSSINELNDLKSALKNTQAKTIALDEEADRAAEQVEIESDNLEKLRKLVDNFAVPDVMEYVHLKEETYNTNRLIKMWNRKMGIQRITLNTVKTKLLKMVGINTAKWMVRRLKRNEMFDVEDLFIDWNRTSVEDNANAGATQENDELEED